MPARHASFPLDRWCSRHRTNSYQLPGECPACQHRIHFHADQMAAAGRGAAIRERCSNCKVIYGLVPVKGYVRYVIRRIEGGLPVFQLAMKG